ncbi:MAG: thioredoxin family protein [Ignavibacteriaceae bacterium]
MMIVLYVVFGIIALIMLMQYVMIFSAKKSKGTKLAGLKGNLKKLESNGTKGLVYFFSPSCHACKAQTPVIKTLQSNYKNVYDVDISKDFQTARVFGIKATPTTIAVEDGVIRQVFLGVKPQEFLEKYLRGNN